MWYFWLVLQLGISYSVMISWKIWFLLKGFFLRLDFCMVKYLNFHNSSSFALRYFFDVNGNATMWNTPCLRNFPPNTVAVGGFGTNYIIFHFADIFIKKSTLCQKNWKFNQSRQSNLNPSLVHQRSQKYHHSNQKYSTKFKKSIVLLLYSILISQNFQNKKLKCSIRNFKFY